MASRNKLTLNKIKKIFKEIGKSIKNALKKLYLTIKSLPKKVKIITILWLIIFIIIIILISSTSKNNERLEKYHSYEDLINEAALRYVESNHYYGTKAQKIRVDLEELKDANLITENNLPDKTCKGYSLTYYDYENNQYISSSYINCSKYTSDDYYDFK